MAECERVLNCELQPLGAAIAEIGECAGVADHVVEEIVKE